MKRPRTDGGKPSGQSDDTAVWHQVAASVEPLKGAKGRVHKSASSGTMTLASVAPKATPPRKPERSLRAEPQAVPPPAVRANAPPPLAEFDRKSNRKIRSGRVEIEARVDLHGMRQDEAHLALRTFLKRSQARGLRWVLVITGKGKALASEATAERSQHERGVLKRNVPRWLEEADLRALVVSFTNAALHHGGEGALYVHLRNKDKV